MIKDKDILLNIEAKTDVIDYKLEQDTLDIINKIKDLELYSINIDVELATKELVQNAHDNNIKVFVYNDANI